MSQEMLKKMEQNDERIRQLDITIEEQKYKSKIQSLRKRDLKLKIDLANKELVKSTNILQALREKETVNEQNNETLLKAQKYLRYEVHPNMRHQGDQLKRQREIKEQQTIDAHNKVYLELKKEYEESPEYKECAAAKLELDKETAEYDQMLAKVNNLKQQMQEKQSVFDKEEVSFVTTMVTSAANQRVLQQQFEEANANIKIMKIDIIKYSTKIKDAKYILAEQIADRETSLTIKSDEAAIGQAKNVAKSSCKPEEQVSKCVPIVIDSVDLTMDSINEKHLPTTVQNQDFGEDSLDVEFSDMSLLVKSDPIDKLAGIGAKKMFRKTEVTEDTRQNIGLDTAKNINDLSKINNRKMRAELSAKTKCRKTDTTEDPLHNIKRDVAKNINHLFIDNRKITAELSAKKNFRKTDATEETRQNIELDEAKNTKDLSKINNLTVFEANDLNKDLSKTEEQKIDVRTKSLTEKARPDIAMNVCDTQMFENWSGSLIQANKASVSCTKEQTESKNTGADLLSPNVDDIFADISDMSNMFPTYETAKKDQMQAMNAPSKPKRVKFNKHKVPTIKSICKPSSSRVDDEAFGFANMDMPSSGSNLFSFGGDEDGAGGGAANVQQNSNCFTFDETFGVDGNESNLPKEQMF